MTDSSVLKSARACARGSVRGCEGSPRTHGEAAEFVELTRMEEGGPRLARDDPATQDMSSARSGAAFARFATGAGKGVTTAAAPIASRMAPTADSTRALSQPPASP